MKKIISNLVLAAFLGINFVSAQLVASDTCLTFQTAVLMYKSKDTTTSKEISKVQDFLVSKKMFFGTPTGYYGPLTVKAVKKYQKSKGVKVTGNVGLLTKSAVQKETCTKGETSPLISNIHIQASNLPVVTCTMERLLCSDGTLMPRDSDCTWRSDKCTTKNVAPHLSKNALPASIKVYNMYDTEITEDKLFDMFTISGIDYSKLMSLTLKKIDIIKGDYVSIKVDSSCNTIFAQGVEPYDTLYNNYSIHGVYKSTHGSSSLFSCPVGIKDLKNSMTPASNVATITTSNETVTYSITDSESWGANADVNGRVAPSGRLSFYGVKADGTQELLKTVTFRYYIK